MKTSIEVAQVLLDLAKSKNESLTPMALIKLVYLCHGWMLGIHGRPLIEEKVEAWQYGPVIPELYGAIRHHRSKPVERLLPSPDNLDTDEQEIIADVFKAYPNDAIVLSRLTHQIETPWHETWHENRKYISDDRIKHHFIQKIAAHHADDN